MLDFVRRNRVLVTSLCCLALAAVLVASTATGRGRADAFGRLLLDVMALFRRRAELDWMEQRIATLEEQTVRLDEVERENARLRDLLAFRERLAGDVLAAAVVGRDATGLARTLTIDRGERDGVVKGAAVLAPAGVVGQVFLAGAHASRVLLI